jgi:hypothetical protein
VVPPACSTRLTRSASKGKTERVEPLKVLSPDMQKVFGNFEGRIANQRSPPRWVEPQFVERATEFVKGLG